MRRFLSLAVCSAILASSAHATVTLSLEGGILRNSAGTAMPNGGLILLVASTTDSTFSTPTSTSPTTAGSTIAGDDVIVAAFTASQVTSGNVGGYNTVLSAYAYSGNVSAGDPLQLYWFPTLTTANTTLGQATAYGSYRTDSVLGGSTTGWVLPSDGSTVTLNFFTTSGGGSLADALGNASLATDGTVVTAPGITTHPASQTVTAGASVTFSVVATGTSPSYQWKKGGNDISGANSASYTIAATTTADAGSYTVTVSNTAGNVTSNAATLTVNIAAPTIGTQPASLSVNAGSPAIFTVGANGTGLSYQWRKGTTAISGATSATYTITSPALSDAGNYNVVVTNSAGNVTSNNATLTVLPVFTAPAPDGYAATTTGGALGSHSLVTTAAEFRTLAESSNAAVITVSGSLDLGATKVAVKSNKTIQGLDGTSTIIGNLELASVSHVVIRGINLTNPNGDGLTISGATNVYVTHVSFYNCSDTLLRIVNGADNITVSWCEFYYTSAQATHRYATLIGATSGETKALHVTLANNWYSDRADQQMPDSTYGQVHQYNNYLNPNGTANTSGSIARANAQFLSERNQYTSVVSPLTKTGGGLIRAIENGYTTTTGTAADTGTDSVFTPTYSYRLMSVSSVATLISASAGNTTGASSPSGPAGSAAINATATSVTTGNNFSLSATSVSGITASTYQWRLANADIAGATSATYTVTGAQSANAGIYTVAVSNTSGETIVSTPVTISVNAAPVTPPTPPASGGGGGGGGGGGAPSIWFFAALAALGWLRRFAKKS